MQNRFQHREGNELLSCCLICMLLWTMPSRFYWFCVLSHICPMYGYMCWIQLSSSNESTEKLFWMSLGYKDRRYICQWTPFQLWWLIVANKKISLCLEELFSLAGSCHPGEVDWTRIYLAQSFSISRFYTVPWHSNQRPAIKDIEISNNLSTNN